MYFHREKIILILIGGQGSKQQTEYHPSVLVRLAKLLSPHYSTGSLYNLVSIF